MQKTTTQKEFVDEEFVSVIEEKPEQLNDYANHEETLSEETYEDLFDEELEEDFEDDYEKTPFDNELLKDLYNKYNNIYNILDMERKQYSNNNHDVNYISFFVDKDFSELYRTKLASESCFNWIEIAKLPDPFAEEENKNTIDEVLFYIPDEWISGKSADFIVDVMLNIRKLLNDYFGEIMRQPVKINATDVLKDTVSTKYKNIPEKIEFNNKDKTGN